MMEKKILIIFIVLSFAYSFSMYPSAPDPGAWEFQITPSPTVGAVQYAVQNDPRCSACKRGQFCRISNGQPICKPYCGDGIVAGIEALQGNCDDGNQDPMDGCNKCKVSPEWFCGNKRNAAGDATGVPGAISVCSYACGDG